MQKLIAISALLALSACADATKAINSDVSTAKLQQSTASLFKTSPSNVSVGNMRAGITGTKYQARIGRNLFDCHYIRGSATCDLARR